MMTYIKIVWSQKYRIKPTAKYSSVNIYYFIFTKLKQNCFSQNYPKGNIPVTMERTTKYMQHTVMIDKSGKESKSSVMYMCKHIYVNGEFITCKYTYVGRVYYIPSKTPITV